MTLLQKYEKALEVAQGNENLQCLILQIQQTIGKLKCEEYEPTSSEEVWVDYFLEKNDREECNIPPVEMIEREKVAYVKGMEKYLQELKNMDRSDAKKKSLKNLVQCGVIQENGGN